MSRMRKRFLDCSNMTIEEATQWGTDLAQFQRDIMFMIGDLARYAEAKWGENHFQVWPEWVSPGMLARAAGVAKAFPEEEDRRHECTYTQYMQVANKSDRHALLGVVVDKGQTTDESRKAAQNTQPGERPRWLLAVDVHLYVHKWYHSGAVVEAAANVSQWIQRTVERLKDKNLTDCVCCFDGPNNFRKKLTEGWEDKEKYKGGRGPKEQELIQQLQLVRELLEGFGFACLALDGYESDDCMASFAVHFPGKVTLLSADKDMRMCLTKKCNILRDVEWEDDSNGNHHPVYHFVSAKSHTEDGCAYNSVQVKDIRPEQWADFQMLAGDPVDNISGAHGIGAKIAADLIKQFGTVEGAIAAAKAGDESIREKKRTALIEFEGKLDVTRQLVTLRNDLPIQSINTRLI